MTREESEKGKKRVGQALWNTGSTSAPHLSSQTFATTHTALPYVRNGQPLSVPLPGSGLNPTAASGPMPISVMGLTSGNGTGILPPPRSVWSQETLSSASAWPQYGGTGYYAHLPVSWGQTRDR
ncbi:hypothetical protein TREMEDRAFT_56141 [Tremella mesenterica DSM 1558]|nr:uncharacterized protein TREMEDRAFT_56141 [Tremella mesenterica DSM 1558]EIW73164.1 hypothetical protein TREMEDRAFT_56141 [Tremella mesenterica DSM 1558]